jgi:MoaA/NifB/PqqE/SkfB family radical SAM enzyme
MINLSEIQLEITTKCNARCPQCVRNYFGSYTWPTIPIIDMDLEWFKTSLSLETWKNLKHIRFCGTYGEPCMHPDLINLIKWIKTVSNARITINTNGGIRTKSWWAELATVLSPECDRVYFGIDGLEDTNHLHRIGVKFSKVINNVTAFNKAGGISIWAFLVFRHNEHQIDEARNMSIDIGCNSFGVKSTSRFVDKQHKLVDNTPVVDANQHILYFLKPTTLSNYKNNGYVDIKSNTDYAQALKTTKISCVAKAENAIYISAEGDVFPCGWLADRLYGAEAEGHKDHFTIMSMISSIGGKEKINLHYTAIDDIVSGIWFQKIAESWKNNSIERCAHQCGGINSLNIESVAKLSATWKNLNKEY